MNKMNLDKRSLIGGLWKLVNELATVDEDGIAIELLLQAPQVMRLVGPVEVVCDAECDCAAAGADKVNGVRIVDGHVTGYEYA